MAERIVLRRALQIHDHHVVGILHAAGEVYAFARHKHALVHNGDALRARAAGPHRVTFGVSHLHLQRERFALTNRLHAA
jgi:hypothetical protein